MGNYSEIELSNNFINIFNQFGFPFAIRDMECRLIYANQATADVCNAKAPSDVIGRFDYEIKSGIFEHEDAIEKFERQYKRVMETEQSFSTLEIHPNAIDYPYIFSKHPYYYANKECIGMIGYNKPLEVYSINDYVKGNMPGSLLLTKPDDFFTERQCEIMFYRLQGLKAKEVAKRLNLAANTFNNYMQTIYDKACVRNLDEFIEFCEKRNYHRYLPRRFLSKEAITFSSSI